MANVHLFRVNGYEYAFSDKSSEFVKTLGFIHTSYLRTNAPFSPDLSSLLQQFQIGRPQQLAMDDDQGSFLPNILAIYTDPHTPLPVSDIPLIEVKSQLSFLLKMMLLFHIYEQYLLHVFQFFLNE